MKRIIAMLLATVMVVSLLSACNKSEGGASGAAKINDDGKYDPGITISLATVMDSDDFEIDGQTNEKNVWRDAYLDKLNISFKDMFVVTSEQYEDKLNMQISAGQVPDFMAVSRKQFEMLVENDLAADLTSAYEEYASDKMKEYINSDGGLCMDMCKSGGKLYAIPLTQGSLESPGVVTWIRKDWLDNLGLEVPETYDELYKVMEAFTFDDPDGNGVDDTFAISTSNELDEWMGFFASYGSYPKSWIKDADGKVVYGGVQPETKEALAALNKMYESGMISREFGANDWDQFIKSIDTSNVGIVYFAWYACSWPLGDVHTESGAEWVPVPIYNVNGGVSKVMSNAGPDTYYVMRKGFENPEALIMMCNLWYELGYGNKEQMLKYHKNEQEEMLADFSPVHPWLAHEDVEYYKVIKRALAGEDVGEMFPSCQTYYEAVTGYLAEPNDDDYFTYKMYGPDSGCQVLDYYIENDLVLSEEYYGSGTETMKDKWGILESKQLEAYIKIIMGEEPIDAFDDFVKEWNENGGETVVKEVQEAVKKK